MSLIVKNDEQIKVGTTPGLIAGESSFTFDGTLGKPDYRHYEIVISELTGRGIMVKDLDYTWNSTTGRFDLLVYNEFPDVFTLGTYYNVHFQPLVQPIFYEPASLIDSSFFIRDINLVNLTETRTLERLNSFISKFEPECLKKILGYTLYKALQTETSQRMTDLVYGTGYISPINNERYWEGLVRDRDISLIANYVYYYFQKTNAQQTVGTSTKLSKSEAGVSDSPADKMITAWRFFASETRAMCSFLWNKSVDDVYNGVRVYPEFTYCDYNRVMEFARPGGVNKLGF